MSHPLSEPLDKERIRAALSPQAQQLIVSLEVARAVESTNTALMERRTPAPGTAEVLLAESQTAGRGRLGRAWVTRPGGAICLSLSWSFATRPADISALSLAMGVCALRALTKQKVADVGLKWPNDILLRDAKLGGILIELRSEPKLPASVVIGIGLNTALSDELRKEIADTGASAADLSAPGHAALSRNTLAAQLIEECLGGLEEFERVGLLPFIEEWRHADALHGKRVGVQSSGETVQGIARGIDWVGALVLETPQSLRKFISGDVTVRLQT